MNETVSAAMDKLGSADLFNQGGLSFITDAWVAAKFGMLRDAEQVRLVEDEWPDCELLSSGVVEKFEITEADAPERRRGQEYRESTGEVEDDPVEDWIERAEAAKLWLRDAVERKVQKNYGGYVNLLILLNLNEFGIRQSKIEECFALATISAKDEFASVWVLWKGKAYKVWPSQTGVTIQG